LDLRLGQRADEAIDRLALDEGDHRRDRLDAELASDARVVVDVHLDQADRALGGAHGLLDDRPERLAGTAPGRPEVDQHRAALGFLEHVLGEGLGGGLEDEIVGRGGRGKAGRSDVHRLFLGSVAVDHRYLVGLNMACRAVVYNSAAGSGRRSRTAGSWPVARMNFRRSPERSEVVAVFTSGWQLTTSCAISS